MAKLFVGDVWTRLRQSEVVGGDDPDIGIVRISSHQLASATGCICRHSTGISARPSSMSTTRFCVECGEALERLPNGPGLDRLMGSTQSNDYRPGSSESVPSLSSRAATVSAVGTISVADKAMFERDGFFVRRGFFAPAEMAVLVDAFTVDEAIQKRAYGADDGQGCTTEIALWNEPGDDRSERLRAANDWSEPPRSCWATRCTTITRRSP